MRCYCWPQPDSILKRTSADTLEEVMWRPISRDTFQQEMALLGDIIETCPRIDFIEVYAPDVIGLEEAMQISEMIPQRHMSGVMIGGSLGCDDACALISSMLERHNIQNLNIYIAEGREEVVSHAKNVIRDHPVCQEITVSCSYEIGGDFTVRKHTT